MFVCLLLLLLCFVALFCFVLFCFFVYFLLFLCLYTVCGNLFSILLLAISRQNSVNTVLPGHLIKSFNYTLALAVSFVWQPVYVCFLCKKRLSNPKERQNVCLFPNGDYSSSN